MDPKAAPGPAPDSRKVAQRQLGRIAAARRVLATKSLAALAILIVLIVFVIENSHSR
ncbi:MAG: hypothetical protein M3083_13640 [Actinomycetota bacterium]|nr:hypothetical protein [Actinomycetota bacterium]